MLLFIFLTLLIHSPNHQVINPCPPFPIYADLALAPFLSWLICALLIHNLHPEVSVEHFQFQIPSIELANHSIAFRFLSSSTPFCFEHLIFLIPYTFWTNLSRFHLSPIWLHHQRFLIKFLIELF